MKLTKSWASSLHEEWKCRLGKDFHGDLERSSNRGKCIWLGFSLACNDLIMFDVGFDSNMFLC